MKKLILSAAVALVALTLGSCQTPQKNVRSCKSGETDTCCKSDSGTVQKPSFR